MTEQQYKQAFEELKLILDMSFDAITIANGEGVFTRVSRSCKDFFGVDETEMIGKSSKLLEKKGILDVSVTSEVLKAKKRMTIIQKTKANKTVLVTGIPIFKEDKSIDFIINISKDLTETNKIEADLTNLQTELAWYKQELAKRTTIEQNNVAYQSAEMKKIMQLMHHIAHLDVTVLLYGETGTGKGFMANMIHSSSNRAEQPFVMINCGAIPENLLESELFGYEKGAFSGASREGKKGLFEIAGNGTIFLDEIGDIPLNLQVKLLHVLDEKKARSIGGTTSYDVRARIIAATNKNVKEMVQEGTFREDLYYRLHVVPIIIPPLRNRKEDLHYLIESFLTQTNDKFQMKKRFSEEALKILYEYSFPGNIRELQNLVERAVVNTFGEVIEASTIIEMIDPTHSATFHHDMMPLRQAVEQFERKLLMAAFQRYTTTRKVAEVLHIDQSTVVKKAQRLGIPLRKS